MARAAHATTVPALLLAGLATLAMTTPGPLAGAIPVRELPAGGTAGLLRAPLWTAIKAPLPAGAGTSPDSYLYGMACPSASTCAAAGNYVDRAGTSQGLLLTGHGSSWTATKAPLPAAAGASPSDVSLFGVVCPSAVACVAAGSYTDSAGNPEGLLITGHGTSWTAIEAPQPPGAAVDPDVSLSAVTCASTYLCVAAGSYLDSSGNYQGLLIAGHGTSWTATEAPLPANAGASPIVGLLGVTCASASQCIAVGYYTDSKLSYQGLLLTWHRSSWTATEAPLPAGAGTNPGANLSGIACPSASTCVATGAYMNSSSAYQGLLLAGHGSSWTATKAPLPAGTNADPAASLSGVTCPPASTCTVTGYYSSTAGQEGLLLAGRGTAWTATKAPLPTTSTDPEASVGDVTCPATSACLAAGAYHVSSGESRGFLLTGRGSSWTATQPPVPANAQPGSYVEAITSVACPSRASCDAAGYFTIGAAGDEHAMLLTGPADSHPHGQRPGP
jgi:hypothetical protein